MHALRAGDQDALRTLYDRHSPLMYAMVLRVVQDRADAEDLLVDLFWELWDRADRFDPSRGSPLAYMMTMARSRSIDRRRARPKMRAVSLEAYDAAHHETPDRTAMNSERESVVRRALRTLDKAEREAIESAFFDGLSHAEVAEELKKPLGTVKTHIRQGHIRLRTVLRSHYESGAREAGDRQEPH